MSTKPTIALDAQALDPSFDSSKQPATPRDIVSSEPVQLKPSTNQALPSAVQPLPTPKDLLNTTVEGAKEVAQGTRDIGQGPSSGTSISDAIHNTIQGAMKVGTIPMMFAAAVDPLLAARGLAESAGGEYAAKKAATALGASPETAQLAGDIAAVGVPSAIHMLPERPEGSAFGENPEAGFAKIPGSKKVRDATPKTAEPAPTVGRRAGVGGVSRTLPEESPFANVARDHAPTSLEGNTADMGSGGKAWLNADGSFSPQDEVHKDVPGNLFNGNIRIGNLERDGSVLFHADSVPTEAQRAAIGKDIAKQGVIYDLANNKGERISGETDKPGEFWRTIDKFYGTGSEKFTSAGGKFVGKTPEPAAPAAPSKPYHPDLQKVADMYGVHQDPAQAAQVDHASFMTPDGKFVTLPEGVDHDKAIAKAVPERPSSGITGGASDNRPDFMNETQTVRIRPTKDANGITLNVQVPKGGVTPEQVDSLKQMVGGLKGQGHLMLDTATKMMVDRKDTYKEFVRPSDVDSALKKIGVHPDQIKPVAKSPKTTKKTH